MLSNSQSLLSKLSSFVEDKLLTQLDTIEDSNKLGQFMMFEQMISKGQSHPNLQEKPGTKKHKYPQFLAHDLPLFSYSGVYILENKIDRKQQRLFLVGVIALLIFLTFFNLYPFWMQQAIW